MHLEPVCHDAWCREGDVEIMGLVLGDFVLWWGEGICHPKWDRLKSTREGDTAGRHRLVCFPFLEVGKPEGITLP